MYALSILYNAIITDCINNSSSKWSLTIVNIYSHVHCTTVLCHTSSCIHTFQTVSSYNPITAVPVPCQQHRRRLCLYQRTESTAHLMSQYPPCVTAWTHYSVTTWHQHSTRQYQQQAIIIQGVPEKNAQSLRHHNSATVRHRVMQFQQNVQK